MSAPSSSLAKDSQIAAAALPAVVFAKPIVNDPLAALDEAIRRQIDGERALGLIASAIFEMAPDDPEASIAFAATEVLRREIKAIITLLDGVYRSLEKREKEAAI